jgi:acetyl-CoA C-acetyltransferase
MVKNVYLAGGVRTAIGGFAGAFNDVPVTQLGATVIKAAMQRAGLAPDKADEVIMGCVLQGATRPNPARQSAILAGIPDTKPAYTINQLCISGLQSIISAAQKIQCGDAAAIVAGGMESMSRAPYILDKARAGFRMGHGEIYDSMLYDALIDAFDGRHMGACGDAAAAKYGLSKADQDAYAVASYKRAIKAQADGHFAREIVPVEIATRKGTVIVDKDEEPTRFVEEKFHALKPAFSKDGTVTAGNASSVNDGAAAIVVIDGDAAAKLGVQCEARIVGYSVEAREPEWFTLAPIKAIDSLLKKLVWNVDDADLYELNEAFSCVPMAAMKDLGIPHDRLNVYGGAVALGHPIGCSGCRVVVTLLNAMRERGVKRGVAALCVGGGMGGAIAVERL